MGGRTGGRAVIYSTWSVTKCTTSLPLTLILLLLITSFWTVFRHGGKTKIDETCLKHIFGFSIASSVAIMRYSTPTSYLRKVNSVHYQLSSHVTSSKEQRWLKCLDQLPRSSTSNYNHNSVSDRTWSKRHLS